MKYLIFLLLLCGCSSSISTTKYIDCSDNTSVEFTESGIVVSDTK